jgi:NADH-quinone oxidoreductase subunit J
LHFAFAENKPDCVKSFTSKQALLNAKRMTLTFLILAALTTFGTAAAMSLKNLVHSILALMLGLLGLALIFLQLGAQFVGFTQVIVYVGAVAILAMFAIMMTRSAHEGTSPANPKSPRAPFMAALGHEWAASIFGIAIAFAVFALLAWSFVHGTPAQHSATPQPTASVQQIGDALMHRFAVPFEIIGLLLTAALIGAAIIALEERKPDESEVAR